MMVVDLGIKPRGFPRILRDPQRSWGAACDGPLAVTLTEPANPPGSIWKLMTWVVGRKRDGDILMCRQVQPSAVRGASRRAMLS